MTDIKREIIFLFFLMALYAFLFLAPASHDLLFVKCGEMVD